MNKILMIAGVATLALVGLCSAAWGIGKAVSGKRTETHAVVAHVHSVVVDVDRGDVTLVPGGQVSVRATRRWDFRSPHVTRSVRDGVLTVKARCGGAWPLSSCSTNLRVAIPAGVAVKATTNVGDVTGRGLETGNAFVRTNVGDVHMGLDATPAHLAVETNVGDVSLDVPRGRYAVHTVSHIGDDRVDGLVQDDTAAASIRAITDVGDVALSGR
jgi:hypothetical protein